MYAPIALSMQQQVAYVLTRNTPGTPIEASPCTSPTQEPIWEHDKFSEETLNPKNILVDSALT